MKRRFRRKVRLMWWLDIGVRDVFEQKPICVSDFGEAVYRCRYTGTVVFAIDAVVIGAIIPGVKAHYVMSPSNEAKGKYKESKIAFHENEANCNTCRHLARVKHDKDVAGFLFGRCTNNSGIPQASPYWAQRREGDIMIFHPDDPMHMPCYTSRWNTMPDVQLEGPLSEAKEPRSAASGRSPRSDG